MKHPFLLAAVAFATLFGSTAALYTTRRLDSQVIESLKRENTELIASLGEIHCPETEEPTNNHKCSNGFMEIINPNARWVETGTMLGKISTDTAATICVPEPKTIQNLEPTPTTVDQTPLAPSEIIVAPSPKPSPSLTPTPVSPFQECLRRYGWTRDDMPPFGLCEEFLTHN